MDHISLFQSHLSSALTPQAPAQGHFVTNSFVRASPLGCFSQFITDIYSFDNL